MVAALPFPIVRISESNPTIILQALALDSHPVQTFRDTIHSGGLPR